MFDGELSTTTSKVQMYCTAVFEARLADLPSASQTADGIPLLDFRMVRCSWATVALCSQFLHDKNEWLVLKVELAMDIAVRPSKLLIRLTLLALEMSAHTGL